MYPCPKWPRCSDGAPRERERRVPGPPPAAEPGGRVLFPGQSELMEREKRLREGIPLGRQLMREFDELAAHYGVKNTLATRSET